MTCTNLYPSGTFTEETWTRLMAALASDVIDAAEDSETALELGKKVIALVEEVSGKKWAS